jgi:hypothetical protein
VHHSDEIWMAIQRSLSAERWTRLSALYAAIERILQLDAEDFEPEAPGSSIPKWKRNVRNVLQQRKAWGHVLWERPALYRLP